MHGKLSKSPITYVIAQVQFSTVESIEKYIPELQDRIRKYFPIFDKINIHTIELRENQPGNLPTLTALNQWHFKDKDSFVGVLLDGRSIAIHTSKYDQFAKLTERFEQVLKDINDVLHLSLFVRLGIRYINVIKTNLNEHIKPALLGFHLEESKYFDSDRYLSNTELIQKSKSGLIKVKSTYIGSNEIIIGGQNSFVPNDLSNVASYLSFAHYEPPKDKFLILDIDHFENLQGDFEVNKVLNNLRNLHTAVYEAFCASVTAKALADWK